MNRNDLIKQLLAKKAQQKNGDQLPEVYSPDRSLVRAKIRHGLLSSIGRTLRQMENSHEAQRVEIELRTGNRILEIEAEQAVKIAKIRADTNVEDYRDKAARWIEKMQITNRATTQLELLHEFKEDVEEVIKMELPRELEEFALTLLYEIYFGPSTNGMEEDA